MSGTGPGQTTDSSDALPWDEGDALSVRLAPHLVICWCLDEPLRVGEVAPVREALEFGRGGAEVGGPPRLAFFRQRPRAVAARPPLASRRLSRRQLSLRPLPGGRLRVENLGRCPLFVDGQAVTEAVVGSGATLHLKNALLLLVVERPIAMERPTSYPETVNFAFGAPDPNGLVGESPAIWTLRDRLAFTARLRDHVIFHGPSGCGKELAARAVHGLSSRSGRPFVARNAATLPEALVDAEVFGTAKDYPNAGMPKRPGLVAEADGGCLFLDEIGELPERLQAHLLRVMDQGGEFQRLGEAQTSRADVRFLAATNRSLDALKHDFAARFKLRVEVPGLAERREDIPLLVYHLVRHILGQDAPLATRFCERTEDGGLVPRLDPLLLEALTRHDYRGHTRELERLLLTAIGGSRDDFIAFTPELQRTLHQDQDGPDGAALGPSEIRRAIERAEGNITRAASSLGLKNRFVLYRLMKRHGLPVRADEG